MRTLITALKDRGVTIFLTTHRLEEAERLCDRVAILNTTMRLIGRPRALRAQLFRRSIEVRLRAGLAESRHSLEDVYLQLVDEDLEAKR